MEISEILKTVVEKNASDLHLKVGKPPIIRLDGRLDMLDYKPLTPEVTEQLMKSVTSPQHQKKLQELGNTDFGFSFGNLARFRVAIYKEKGNIGIALRLIPYKLMSFEDIGLPTKIQELLYRPRGLILVTGPTGCGKTTTLATMINYINENRESHIVTVENPIEYYHEHKKSLVTQREVGVDVTTFEEGLMRALRQDPDVILVGEMRDIVTMQAALTAAETGHLVFSTLHTTGACQSIDRVIDAFPHEQQEQVRTQMGANLVAVVSQQLMPRVSGEGRIAAFEIMIATPAIKSLIREKKTFRIISSIQTGAKEGMMTLDDHLIKLHKEKLISYEEVIIRCNYPGETKIKLQEESS